MKTFKKISLGLVLLAALPILSVVRPNHALAYATLPQVKLCGQSQNLKFTNFGQITCTISGVGTITFTDNNIDSNALYEYDYSENFMCQATTTPEIAFGSTPSLQDVGKPLKVTIYVNYPGNPGCNTYSQNVTITDTANLAVLLAGGQNSAQSLSSQSAGKIAGFSYSRYNNGLSDPGSGVRLYSQNGTDPLSNGCSGSILAVGSSGASAKEYRISSGGQPLSDYSDLSGLVSANSGCGVNQADFGLDNSPTPVGFKISPPVTQTISDPIGQTCDPNKPAPPGTTCVCNSSGINAGTTSCTYVATGSTGTGTCSSTTPNCQSSEQACEAASGTWGLSWLACPVLVAADSLANTLTNTFEQQLSFRLSTDNSTTGSDLSNHNGQASVQKAWDLVKYIASAFLIIVMLIMVISQAVGGGPFDAYTVRKMLPRLVAAVILMQLSWFLIIWLVNAIDDLGRGLADIMYSPFGGPGNLNNFFVLLSNAHVGGTAVIGSWVGLIGIIVAGAVALPMVLMFCFMAIVAILTGLAVLILRKIFIILALIFAPVIILAWILPGTQNLYKRASDAFIKILMMFPIVVAIIAGGRIFAYVVGTQDNGTLINFFLVLVGFFGPLFILPKTYKWGGELMQFAGQGASKVNTMLAGKDSAAGKYFRGRQESLKNEKIRESQERYQRGYKFGLNRNWREGFGVPSVWRRPTDLVRSGRVDPLLVLGPRRRYEESMSKYRAAGVASEEEEGKIADQDFSQAASISENHDALTRDVIAAAIGSTVTYNDRFGNRRTLRVTRAMKRAGMNAGVKFGTDRTLRILSRTLDDLNHGDAEDQIMAERFRDANVSALKPKMDYLYRGSRSTSSDFIPEWVVDPATGVGSLGGPIVSRVDALNPEAFAGMEAPELESMLAGLSSVAMHHADAGARAAAQSYLDTIYGNYEAALNNDQVRRAMGPSLNQAMKAHLDGTGLTERNDDRVSAGITGVGTVIEQAIPSPTVTAIAGRIQADGRAS